MPMPDFQSFFKPLLELATDTREHSLKGAREKLASRFELSDEELAELLPSGTQRTFDNRVAWAKSYLVQAGALKATRRAHFQITDRGLELLNQGHDRIDVKVLKQYAEFVEFHTPAAREGNREGGGEPSRAETPSETPEEVLQQAYESVRNDLAAELLNLIKQNTPAFFEKLVVDLMVAMGYGGSRADAGRSVGQSGDEGIDGIIKEDRLGLDVRV